MGYQTIYHTLHEMTLKWTFKAIFYKTHQQSCYPSFGPITSRLWWATWNVLTSGWWAFVKYSSYDRHVSNPSRRYNHYTGVYGINSNKLKDKDVGHQRTYWRTMKYCISDIHAFGARYERTNCYSRTDFHAQEVPINKVKSIKEPGPCYKCSGPHFQCRFMKNESYPSEKFQNCKKIDNSHKSQQNDHNNGQFPTSTISFKASKQVKPCDDISPTVNTIQHLLGKIGEKYTLQMKSNTSSDIPKS